MLTATTQGYFVDGEPLDAVLGVEEADKVKQLLTRLEGLSDEAQAIVHERSVDICILRGVIRLAGGGEAELVSELEQSTLAINQQYAQLQAELRELKAEYCYQLERMARKQQDTERMVLALNQRFQQMQQSWVWKLWIAWQLLKRERRANA